MIRTGQSFQSLSSANHVEQFGRMVDLRVDLSIVAAFLPDDRRRCYYLVVVLFLVRWNLRAPACSYAFHPEGPPQPRRRSTVGNKKADGNGLRKRVKLKFMRNNLPLMKSCARAFEKGIEESWTTGSLSSKLRIPWIALLESLWKRPGTRFHQRQAAPHELQLQPELSDAHHSPLTFSDA
jgi:hypothetical protein